MKTIETKGFFVHFNDTKLKKNTINQKVFTTNWTSFTDFVFDSMLSDKLKSLS